MQRFTSLQQRRFFVYAYVCILSAFFMTCTIHQDESIHYHAALTNAALMEIDHSRAALTNAALMEIDESDARLNIVRSRKTDISRTNCIPTKETFLTCVGNMVREENTIIESYRARLFDIHLIKQLIGYNDLEDIQWLNDMKIHYGAKDDAELLRRIDIVPIEMALAQSLLESGWGTSYAARVGKGLFGQIQSRGTHSTTVPWTPGPDRPQPFDSHRESVTAYFINLNTHPAYAGFRAAREQTKDSIKLMNHMTRYSVRGHDYIKQIQDIIITLQKTNVK